MHLYVNTENVWASQFLLNVLRVGKYSEAGANILWSHFPDELADGVFSRSTKSRGQYSVPASIMKRQDQKWRMFLHFS